MAAAAMQGAKCTGMLTAGVTCGLSLNNSVTEPVKSFVSALKTRAARLSI